MDLVIRHDVRQELTIRLNVHQRLVVNQNIALRLEALVRDLRDERYEAEKISCEKCHHVMTKEDILQGFLDSPTDYTTGCPDCGYRFLVNLVSSNQVYLQFLCPAQTLYSLNDLNSNDLYRRSPKFISKSYPSVYRSALYHFGSLNNAFEKLGKKYSYSPIHTWDVKVIPYLGNLPDARIAELIKVQVWKVRKLRVSLNIKRYLKSNDI